MKFDIKPGDNFIWNLSELVDFLINHQGQDIIIGTNTEGCCASAVGLYNWIDKFKFNSVTIQTSNVLEAHPKYNIRYILPWKFVEVSCPIESALHTWNKKAKFGTVYGRPLWHRLGIAAHLLTRHADDSCVGLVADHNHADARELWELTQLWQYDPAGLEKFSQIQNKLPIFHPEVTQYTPGATLTDGFVAQTKNVYQNFLIDIVAETFTTGNCFFLTEKTIRPMLLKKPFIVFGPKDHLLYLRQMGFRTFADFWDESYDGFSGEDRYQQILKLIDQLSVSSYDQLESMYWDMTYSLDHNYNLLMSQSYNKSIGKII